MEKTAKKNKRIGIDARFYGPIGKGLGRYTQEIVDGVIELDKNNEYVVFLCRENYSSFISSDPRVKKVLADVRWYTIAEQIMMPFYIWREKIDLMHFPHFNVPILSLTPFVVTIHDLILIRYPTKRASKLNALAYRLKNFAYHFVIRFALRRSRKIITVSNFTKNDILDLFPIKADKIEVTYEGVAESINGNFDDDNKVISGYNIHKPYLLYVGNAYPHKNIEGLFEIFSKIKQNFPNISLVLVGKEDYFYTRLKEQAKRLPENNSIIFAGYVPDKELESVYRQAEAYIFPSLYEGFGLPPLEAMSKGLPVASSDRGSMKEILGDAALYFNPENNEDMLLKIKQILEDQSLRSKLIEKGYIQAKKYHWSQCAQDTLNVYKKALNNDQK